MATRRAHARTLSCPGAAGRTESDIGLVARGDDFAFSTTLAGRAYARAIPRWQPAGYRVSLIFLSLPSPEVAIARVAERVQQGGHLRSGRRRASRSTTREPRPFSWIGGDKG